MRGNGELRARGALLWALFAVAVVNGEQPLTAFSVSGRQSLVQFHTTSTKPALLRLRVTAGQRRLTAMYHVLPGPSVHEVSLAGIPAGELADGSLLFEAEFRYRSYLFERWVGGTGKTEGRFVGPVAIEAGSQNRVYVADQGNDRIQVFNQDYRYLFEFGGFAWDTAKTGNEVQEGRFDQPAGLTEGSNKELFVSDRGNHRIVRYDLQGRFLGEFGKDDLRLPGGLAANRLGHVIVCDTDNDRVLRYDTTGRLDTEVGSFGRGRQQFNGPVAAAYDPAGNLYVVDGRNERIQVFDRSLRPCFEIKLEGVRPVGLDVDDEHVLYVVDGAQPRVLVLNNAFQAVYQLPGPSDAFKFTQPLDVATTGDGRLHVVDGGRNAIALIRVEQVMLVKRGKIRVAASR